MENRIFFTGDQHFYHLGVIQHAHRPFIDVETMNLAMIEAWNEVVDIHDFVFVLGDFIWHGGSRAAEILAMLKGQIYLVPGDHDAGVLHRPEVKVMPYIHQMPCEDKRLVLCHWPLRTWPRMHYGSIHLHAHCHGRGDEYGNQLDVGVDTHEFRPWTLDEILVAIKERVPPTPSSYQEEELLRKEKSAERRGD